MFEVDVIGALGKVACSGVALFGHKFAGCRVRLHFSCKVLYERTRSVVGNLISDHWQWLMRIYVMELNKKCEIQDHTNGTDEYKAILSEDALRKLSKSLTALIPKHVDSLEENTFAYGVRPQAEKEC